MSDKSKTIGIEDYDNIENIIKKVLPGFTAISQRMAGPVADFSQSELSRGMSIKPPKSEPGFKRHQLFLISQRGK